jgi:hypothetical protein
MKLFSLLNEDYSGDLGFWYFKNLILSEMVPVDYNFNPYSNFLVSGAVKKWMEANGKSIEDAYSNFKKIKRGKTSEFITNAAAELDFKEKQTISSFYNFADDVQKISTGKLRSIELYYHNSFEAPPTKLNDCQYLSFYGFNGIKEISPWFPSNIGTLAFYKCGEVNFKNIDKVLKSCKKLEMGFHGNDKGTKGESSYLGKNVIGWIAVPEFEGFLQFHETKEKDIEVMWILNDYLGGDKLECQDALFDAGLDEYANQ